MERELKLLRGEWELMGIEPAAERGNFSQYLRDLYSAGFRVRP